MEQTILAAAIADRTAWQQIHEHIDKSTFSPPVQFWWDLVDGWYRHDSAARSVDRSVLEAQGLEKLATSKHRETIVAVLRGLADTPSAVNVAKLVLQQRRTNLVYTLAGAVTSNKEKDADKAFQELQSIWQAKDLNEKRTVKEAALPAEQLFSVVGAERRIPVGSKLLRERIGGGVLPGQSILVFGRTEVGKSTFVIDMACRLAKNKQKVLYVGNEDNINVLKMRFMCRMLRRTQQELESNPDRAVSEYGASGGEENLHLLHLNPGTLEDIREDIEAIEPTVLVIDQIRNLGGRAEDGMTQRMEQNGIRFRSILGEYNLVGIAVTQAGNRDERHNQDSPIWLSTGDVDSSRVGLPATFDLMLGIGGNAEMLARGQRAVSLCKNKLATGPLSRTGYISEFDLARSLVT
jgi:KaiC/GvpD/RAD55 family RecA-like ATPase